MDDTSSVETQKKENPYLMPSAIVIAGLVIGGAVLLSDSRAANDPAGPAQNADTNVTAPKPENARAVGEGDHVKGGESAEVTIIEYSDIQCPFCERLHPTIERVVNESNGRVRWVYRHFPLTAIHQNAQSASVATECAADLKGNDAFWVMLDELFKNQTKLGTELYVTKAKALGIPEGPFRDCLKSNKFDAKIEGDTKNAIDAGGQGTPYVVILNKDGEATSFSGALPYDQVKSFVTQALGDAGAAR